MADTLAAIFMRREYADPLAILRPYRVAVTVPEALQYLYNLSGPVKILGLYKHYFPAEFDASKADPFPVDRQIYSDREIEFFGLMHERMFPLAYWFLDTCNEGEDDDGRVECVPVYPESMDWEEGSPESFSMGWRLLLGLCGYVELRSEYYNDPDIEDDIAERVAAIKEEGIEDLGRTALRAGVMCEDEHSPIKRFLLDAIEMIERATGCPWLDAYEDQALGPVIIANWTIEEINWLEDEYETCEEIKGRAEDLVRWLETSYENRSQLVDLWERAMKEDKDGNDEDQAGE